MLSLGLSWLRRAMGVAFAFTLIVTDPALGQVRKDSSREDFNAALYVVGGDFPATYLRAVSGNCTESTRRAIRTLEGQRRRLRQIRSQGSSRTQASVSRGITGIDRIIEFSKDRYAKNCISFKGSVVDATNVLKGTLELIEGAFREAREAAKACDVAKYDAAIAKIAAVSRRYRLLGNRFGARALDAGSRVDRLTSARARIAAIKIAQKLKRQARLHRNAARALNSAINILDQKKAECFAHCKEKDDKVANGLIVSPMVAFGIGNDRAKGNYSSTGAQAGFDGSKVTEAQNALAAGVDVLIPLSAIFGDDPLSRATNGQFLQAFSPLIGIGLRGNLLFQNKKVAVDVVRHGADGRVKLSERELANIGLYFMMGIPVSIRLRRPGRRVRLGLLAQETGSEGGASRLNMFFYGGVGPSFTRTQVTITSNKVPGGGVFTSNRQTQWDTGLGVIAGVKVNACNACAFGNPLRIGLEWQGRWNPKRNIATTSPTFGFVESGQVKSRFSHQFLFTVSIPFTIGLR